MRNHDSSTRSYGPVIRGLARGITFGCLLLLLAYDARASVIYHYTGNPFTHFSVGPNPYTTSDYVHGYFAVPTALAPNLTNADLTGVITSFVFHDFANNSYPIDSSVLPAGFFLAPAVTTDAGGNIVYWSINVTNGLYTHYITTYSNPGQSGDFNLDVGDLNAQAGPYAWNIGSPGTWSITPEPSALLLVCTGLLGLAARGSRRRPAASR